MFACVCQGGIGMKNRFCLDMHFTDLSLFNCAWTCPCLSSLSLGFHLLWPCLRRSSSLLLLFLLTYGYGYKYGWVVAPDHMVCFLDSFVTSASASTLSLLMRVLLGLLSSIVAFYAVTMPVSVGSFHSSRCLYDVM